MTTPSCGLAAGEGGASALGRRFRGAAGDQGRRTAGGLGPTTPGPGSPQRAASSSESGVLGERSAEV